jgi:antitoxin component YwqK of YwqJK toxin-antitoxin module
MKIKFFTLLTFILFAVNGFSQKTIQLLDSQFNYTTNNLLVKYTRTIDKLDNGQFSVQIYFQTGELMMNGTFLDEKLNLPNGEFNYYFANGIKESQGYYYNGQRVGVWQRWNFDGAKKPDRFYKESSELITLN